MQTAHTLQQGRAIITESRRNIHADKYAEPPRRVSGRPALVSIAPTFVVMQKLLPSVYNDQVVLNFLSVVRNQKKTRLLLPECGGNSNMGYH